MFLELTDVGLCCRQPRAPTGTAAPLRAAGVSGRPGEDSGPRGGLGTRGRGPETWASRGRPQPLPCPGVTAGVSCWSGIVPCLAFPVTADSRVTDADGILLPAQRLHSSGGGDAAYAKAQSMLCLENFATFQQSPLFRILHHLLQPIPILAIYPLLPAFSKIVVCSVSFSSWSTVFHFINEKTGGKRSLVTCSN